MNPGRELDALIAEKVMGLDICECTPEFRKQRREALNKSRSPFEPEFQYPQFGTDGKCNDCGKHQIDSRRYSTDIAAAWEVVEKLGGNMFQLHYDTRYGHEGRTGWSVVLDGVVTNEFIETAPHAICLAALKALSISPCSEAREAAE